jgi:hypothetical protein
MARMEQFGPNEANRDVSQPIIYADFSENISSNSRSIKSEYLPSLMIADGSNSTTSDRDITKPTILTRDQSAEVTKLMVDVLKGTNVIPEETYETMKDLLMMDGFSKEEVNSLKEAARTGADLSLSANKIDAGFQRMELLKLIELKM